MRADDGVLPAFHLHLLNEAKGNERGLDGREADLPPEKRFNDTDASDFIRRAAVRARTERRLLKGRLRQQER